MSTDLSAQTGRPACKRTMARNSGLRSDQRLISEMNSVSRLLNFSGCSQ